MIDHHPTLCQKVSVPIVSLSVNVDDVLDIDMNDGHAAVTNGSAAEHQVPYQTIYQTLCFFRF